MKVVFVAFVALSAGVCSPRAAAAQYPRGPGGVFGGVLPQTGADKQLDLSVSLIEGYDDDTRSTVVGPVELPNLQFGGLSTSLSASLGYASNRSRVRVGVNASSFVRHYAALGLTRNLGNSVDAGLSFPLNRRTTFQFNQSASYSPTYFYNLLPPPATLQPGEAQTMPPEFSVSDLRSYRYSSDASVSHTFGPRTALSVSGAYQYNDRVREAPGWSDLDQKQLRVQLSRSLTANTNFSVGSGYHSAYFGHNGPGRSIEVNVDIGVDHTQHLSATRQVRYRFQLGPSRAALPGSSNGVMVTLRGYRLVGAAGVDYPLGRTWQIQASYRHGIEYVADLPEPVQAGVVSLRLQGYLSQRIDVRLGAGYSDGTSVLTSNNLAFETYLGDVRVRYGLSRNIAAYGEYLYYKYLYSYHDPTGNALPAPGLPRGLERSGARVGLSLWMPAFRR
jgi:hypothetical protein